VSEDGRVPVREDLRDIDPYGAPQLDVPVRLNTNETPYAPPPAFFAELARRVAELDLHRYPDRKAWALRTALGTRYGRPPEQVWAASGSNEVLQQLFQAYGGPGRRLLLFRPGYSMHPLLAKVTLTEVVTADLDEDLRLTAEIAATAAGAHDPDIVCLASPNNPTGIPVDPEVIRVLHDETDALIVLDEAYMEFAVGPGAAGPSASAGAGAGAVADAALTLLDELPRLVVCRTFSKAWRLAGARLGYLLAPQWVVDDLRRVRLPYHLDALVQTAGLVALELAEDMTAHVRETAQERERVAGGLREMGVRVWPSVANFLLLRTELEGAVLFERLLERGVLVRDFSTAPLLDGCLRVTIGTREEDEVFLAAMREALAQRGDTPRMKESLQ
jgi:histidinol-phosphate aminotransferase